MKKNICLITAILTFLCMSISVQAETEIIRITDNGYEDILPAVYGNYVVWQGRQNGEWEIFLYDIAAGQTLQVIDNDYPDIAPQTDGRYVVWLGTNNTGGNIFYYDTNNPNGEITQVTDNWSVKSPPRIADGRIVWAAQGVILGEDTNVIESILPGDIELYDIEAGTTTNISAPADPDGSLDDNTPLIDSTKVVWTQTDSDSIEPTVFVYDLTSGGTSPAPDNFAPVQSTTRDGNLSITTKFDGHDKEIFLTDQRLRKNMQITGNDVDEKQPKINGNHLVWVSGKEAEQEIYLGTTRLLSSISPGDGFAYYKKDYLVFEWEAIGYDRFRVQFSSTKDFTEGETFTFPPLSDPWLYETSLTVDNDMVNISSSPYWRIVAQDQYGNETTSQVRRIVIPRLLSPISPVDGFVLTDKKSFPVFKWEAIGYDRFRVQFSTMASFENKHTHIFPKSDDVWLNEPSINFDKEQTKELTELFEDTQTIYWRIVAQDQYGNETASQVLNIVTIQ